MRDCGDFFAGFPSHSVLIVGQGSKEVIGSAGISSAATAHYCNSAAPDAKASGCIEVTCEIFESAIHRDRGHRLTGSEFAGQLQSSDHVQPRRGPCKNALLPCRPPSHGARRLLVDRAYFVKLAILEMRRAK